MWQKLLKIFAAKNSNNAASIFESYKKKIIMGAIFSALPTICVIFVLIIVIFGPVMMAQQYIDDTKNEVAIFFEKVGNVLTLKGWCSESDGTCQRKAEQKYYEQLNDVYNEYKDKGVEIDVQLITATILYGKVFSEDITYLDDIDSDANSLTEGFEDIKLGDIKKLASNMVSGTRINYDNYRKYLEESYVEKRFSDLYKNEDQKKQIIDHIMSFASLETKKNNNYATGCANYKCKDVYIEGVGKVPVDEYVAAVISAEAVGSSYTPNIEEHRKSLAIAARSILLNRYDICEETIPNTTDFQKFDMNYDEEMLKAATDTAGLVLKQDGKIIPAEYDSFYMSNNYHCDEEFCYATYYKRGLNNPTETHEIKSYAKWQGSFLGGHGRGMSQYGSAYLADIGWSYEEILDYYYEDDVTLESINACPVNSGDYDWRQADPRWGGILMGTSNYTMAAIGCYITSTSIQIARSGTQITTPTFDPGVLLNAMNAAGDINSAGARMGFNGMHNVAPNFKEAESDSFATGSSNSYQYQTIVNFLDNGGYPIIQVPGLGGANEHYVAAVGYDGSDIIIIDPASTGATRLFQYYGYAMGYRNFYKTD